MPVFILTDANAASGSPTPSPSPTSTPVPTATPKSSPTPSATPTSSPTATPVATGVPAKPTLAIYKNWTATGGYDLEWNKWSGNDATSWRVLEDGTEIHRENIAPAGGDKQTAQYHVGNHDYGTYTYQISLINANGETFSDPATYVAGGASGLKISTIDQTSQARQVTLVLGKDTDFTVTRPGGTGTLTISLATNNGTVITFQNLGGGKIRLHGTQAGRSSLQITDTASGDVRYLGVRVRQANGSLPGLPPYVGIGSVSEDTTGDLAFWRSFSTDATNRRVDMRYIYLNGGPKSTGVGWRTWTDQDGFRATSFVRESIKLGMIPVFVWYNIPDGGESYTTDVTHIQNASYMQGYFTDLKFAIDLCKTEAGDEMVGFVLEPDFLGYLAQNNQNTDTLLAHTDSAYTAGILVHGTDPDFPNTVRGLVEAINYIISKNMPTAWFGWQFNLWASPAGGWVTPSGVKGLIRITDNLGVTQGRPAIAKEANAISDFYIKAGVLTHGTKFVSVDKYGLDAGAEGKAASPADSTWFWNGVHWTNYLEFCRSMNTKTGLPVVLWQLPVGRINSTLEPNPYNNGGSFPDLVNTSTHYEDSAPVYFFGDSFLAGGARLDYFSRFDAQTPVTLDNGAVKWGSSIGSARDAGVRMILFGAGVGDSTDGVGTPPTDDYWWITKVQRYYANPVAATGGTSVPQPTPTPSASPSATPVTSPTATPRPTATPAPTATPSASPTATPSGTPNPNVTVQAGNVKVVFTVTQDWGSGFQANFALTNTGTQPINNWELDFNLTPRISSTWDGNVVTQAATGYVATSAGWNATIAPGATVSFGFNASPGGITSGPTNIKVNGTAAPAPSPTPVGSATPLPTATPLATATPLPTATPVPTPAASPLATPMPTATPIATGGPSINGPKIVGYFPEWGVYERNYHVSDIPANELNVINYAFANPDANGGVTMFDAYADVQQQYPGDTAGQPFMGSFNQLNKLKQQYPHLKTMISIGGWTLSANFSNDAYSDTSRAKFATAAVAFMRQYGFDGIDIDWEYPVAGGLDTNTYRTQDKHNFTLLLQVLRTQLNAAAKTDGKTYYLSIAATAGLDNMKNLEASAIAQSVDWINVMAYDLHGPWENVTGHHASLNGTGPSDKLTASAAINAYLAAGVPAKQLVLGVPFYGRSWMNVASGNNGLYQSANGAPMGTYDNTGMFDYRDLVNRLATSPGVYKRYWDATATAPWIYAPGQNNGTFITYEDVQSVHGKTQFIQQKGLGGIMFWDLSGDTKTPADSLLNAIYGDLKQ